MRKDAWGNRYIYESRGTAFEIESHGADNKPGGEGYNADLSVENNVDG